MNKPSRTAAEAMHKASLRRIDFDMKLALEANDNNTLDKLRRERSDVVNECARIAGQTNVSKALNAVGGME